MAIIVERPERIGQIEVRTPWIEARVPYRKEIKIVLPPEEVPPSPPASKPTFWEQYKIPILVGASVLLLILLMRR